MIRASTSVANKFVRDRTPVRRVLNAGAGPISSNRLHQAFAPRWWQEVRLDLDPRTQPDVLGSIGDMRALIPDGSFDAVWSSHNIEHLHAHEVVPALKEFRRILKSDGFAFITCPDLEAVCASVLERGLDQTLYQSAAGPITALDIIYGHTRSIASGNKFMAHHCGFTEETLAKVGAQAGFSEIRVAAADPLVLWALFMMPATSVTALRGQFEGTSEQFLLDD